MISFNAHLHQYSEAGVVLPSVTQVLKAAGLIETGWTTAGAAEFGTRVHAATAQLDRKEKAFGDFEPRVGRYVATWRFWLYTQEAEVLAIEQIVGGIGLGYAGTCDRVVKIDGELVVLDLKTGSPQAWQSLQLAGYAMALGFPIRRLALYLRDDLGVRMHWYEDAEDFAGWRLALALVKGAAA